MPTITLAKTKPREVTRNKSAYQKIYNTPRWKRLRKFKVTENPICEVCAEKGITHVVEEVHHKIPFDINEINEDLAYDYDNLISLCITCHKEAHEKLHQPLRHFPSNTEYRNA
jgi:5-methylcytosine-specific restriction protein A